MLLFAVAVSAVAADSAQSYPNRPIRLVVPFAAGGNADIVGRVIANKLAQRLGQNIVVDNRVSASSIIGTDMVAKSPPDGYTLLLIALTHVTNPGFVGKLPYDSKKDFAPISLVASTPLMMMSYPGFPVKTVKDVIAMAKVRPGQINYSSSGNGSSQNLAGELFKLMAGVDLLHVPYKGTVQSTADVIGGPIELTFTTFTFALPHVKSGKLHGIAMTGARRSPMAPEIPAIAETLPGYEIGQWNGILGPAGMPQTVVARLHREIVAVMQAPDVIERYAALGGEPLTSTPQELMQRISAEIAKWEKVAQAQKIRVDLAR
jgi:tripartite-type tricarboxylate transporter receptor subunit TctC